MIRVLVAIELLSSLASTHSPGNIAVLCQSSIQNAISVLTQISVRFLCFVKRCNFGLSLGVAGKTDKVIQVIHHRLLWHCG